MQKTALGLSALLLMAATTTPCLAQDAATPAHSAGCFEYFGCLEYGTLTPALRASMGVGLAWDSPLGNLRVDYAYPILKQPYDKTQALSFGLRPF